MRTQSPRLYWRSARARSGAEGACPPGATAEVATTGTSAIGFSDGAGASSCDAVVTAAGAVEASAAAGRAQHVSIGPAVGGAAQGAEAAPPIVTIGQQQSLHASAATGVASATTRSAMPRRTMRLRDCITLPLCTRSTRPRHPPGQDLLLPQGRALDFPTLEAGNDFPPGTDLPLRSAWREAPGIWKPPAPWPRAASRMGAARQVARSVQRVSTNVLSSPAEPPRHSMSLRSCADDTRIVCPSPSRS